MDELDFTLEFNSQELSEPLEAEMYAEADNRLRKLAAGHSDLTGAAINVRRPAKAETSFIYEVTTVVYARPNQVVATEKDSDPVTALKGSLKAVERQVRKKRKRLRERWEQPGNDPVSVEIEEIVAAEDEESAP